MSKGLQWTIGISVVLIVLAMVASTILPFFAPRLGLATGYGMMGPGHMFGGRGVMGGFGGMPFFGFNFGMMIVPLLFLGLFVAGIVWLVRSAAAPRPLATTTPCAHCGQPLQTGWKACPHCGEKI